MKALLRMIWRMLPIWLRPYLVIEPLRLLLPKVRNAPAMEPLYIAGYFSSPTGLGQSARLFLQEKKNSGHDARPVDLSLFLSMPFKAGLARNDAIPRDSLAEHAGPGTVIIHINPPALMPALWGIRKLLPGKRIIGYWAWELETIPKFWERCLPFVDEIIVPSSFVAAAIRKSTDKPVHVHPHAAAPAIDRPSGRKRPFTVLSCLEAGSGFYRKNPMAAVNAFKAAFGDASEAQLILKVGSSDRCREGWRQLVQAADTSNIRFCLSYLSESGMENLYAEADAYLSLHRSEGYGLHIQEAMRHGLAVVATGWSGNMDFMQGDACYSVPYSLVPVEDPQNCYCESGAVWAEPDIEAAAAILRTVKKGYDRVNRVKGGTGSGKHDYNAQSGYDSTGAV